MEAAKTELQKPFALAAELAEKEARLSYLNAELNIDDGTLPVESLCDDNVPSQEAVAKSAPSPSMNRNYESR